MQIVGFLMHRLIYNQIFNHAAKPITNFHLYTILIDIANFLEIEIKLRSFNSNEHINEKGVGPYRGLSLFSDTIDLTTSSQREYTVILHLSTGYWKRLLQSQRLI